MTFSTVLDRGHPPLANLAYPYSLLLYCGLRRQAGSANHRRLAATHDRENAPLSETATLEAPTEPSPPGEARPDTAEEPSLWSIIEPVKPHIYGGMALSAVSVICWFGAIMLMWPVLNEVSSTNPQTQQVWALTAAAAVAVIAAVACRVYSFHLSHKGAFELEEILRTELSEHLARVPLGYVINTGSGALKKILLDDIRTLHVFVADSTPLFAKAYATPLLGAILLFTVDWRLALAALALLPLGVVGMTFAFRDHETARRKVDQANENINSVIVEYVQGMQVVRTFDDGSGSLKRFRDALTAATETLKVWTGKTQIGAYIARTLFAALPTVTLVLACGLWLHNHQQVSAAQIVLALALAPTITEGIIPIVWLQQYIVNSDAAVKRINALRRVPALPEADPTTSLTPKNSSIELQNVNFAYDSRRENALTDVSFTAPAGQVTALVGPSGSGKSTIAQLVVRFWDTTSGNVLIGGVNVKDMTADTLMQHVSFVFQSPFLLHDSVKENIRLGKPTASDDDIMAAAKAAQIHDFIVSDLPDGYNTIVGERGSTLSGGQKQRITIARAILQDSPIIILDEATAFADPDNEAKIHAALSELSKGKTILVVAHRLSTIQDADQIIVLDQGHVDDIDTHTNLTQANGVYAQLWRNFERAQGWGLRKNHLNNATQPAGKEN